MAKAIDILGVCLITYKFVSDKPYNIMYFIWIKNQNRILKLRSFKSPMRLVFKSTIVYKVFMPLRDGERIIYHSTNSRHWISSVPGSDVYNNGGMAVRVLSI
jgi:hypothetical protein